MNDTLVFWYFGTKDSPASVEKEAIEKEKERRKVAKCISSS